MNYLWISEGKLWFKVVKKENILWSLYIKSEKLCMFRIAGQSSWLHQKLGILEIIFLKLMENIFPENLNFSNLRQDSHFDQ